MIRISLCRGYRLQQIRLLSADVSHHERLELKPGASKKDIKAAYFKMAKQCHPDLYPDNPTKSEEFLQLQASYNFLMSSESEASTEPDAGTATADPWGHGNNFAAEIDREFLKSVWRDPVPRDITGRHLNSSLLHPSSSSNQLNKALNVGVTGCGVVVAFYCIFKLVVWCYSLREEGEEDEKRRERHEYYKTLNQTRTIE